MKLHMRRVESSLSKAMCGKSPFTARGLVRMISKEKFTEKIAEGKIEGLCKKCVEVREAILKGELK